VDNGTCDWMDGEGKEARLVLLDRRAGVMSPPCPRSLHSSWYLVLPCCPILLVLYYVRISIPTPSACPHRPHLPRFIHTRIPSAYDLHPHPLPPNISHTAHVHISYLACPTVPRPLSTAI